MGNLLKYLLRYRKKNGIENLEKAKVHMDWLIEKEKAMMLQLEALTKADPLTKPDGLTKADGLVGGENDQ